MISKNNSKVYNWNDHFKKASQLYHVEFGTIGGNHTIAELRDLMNAYDYQFTQLSQAYDKAADTWKAADQAAAIQWKLEFDAWNIGTWQPARSHANTVLANTSTSFQNIETDEGTYQATASAFAPLTDFDRRFRQAPKEVAVQAPSYPNNPQPIATDADLGGYQIADKTLKSIQPPNVLNPFTMPLWEKIAIGVVAVLGLGIVLRIATGRIL